jgi:hypothetical protein
MRRVVCLVLLLAWSVACGHDNRSEKTRPKQSSTGPTSVRRAPGTLPPNPVRSSSQKETAHFTKIPEGPWTTLAREITEAQDLAHAVGATRQALARGGIATTDGDQILVNAVGARPTFYASPVETINLALDARNRRSGGRLTVAEMAQMLNGFGWPFPGDRIGPQRDRANTVPVGQVDIPDSARRALQGEAEKQATAGAEAAEADRETVREQAQARVDSANKAYLEAVKKNAEVSRAAALAPPAEKAEAKARAAQALAERQSAFESMRDAQLAYNALLQQGRQAERQENEAQQAAWESDQADAAIRRQIGPNYAAGAQMMQLLASWIGEAVKHPDEPSSFTPLFIAEMAKRQDPPVDIVAGPFIRMVREGSPPAVLTGAPQSLQLRLSLLELELFAAAFYSDETATGVQPAVSPGQDRSYSPTFRLASFSPGLMQDPCSDLKKSFGALGEAGGIGTKEAAQRALRQAVERATDAGTAQAFSRAISAVGIVAKVWKMVAFYASEHVVVTVSDPTVHKPPPGKFAVRFTATTGVSEEDWKEYERLMGGKTGTVADRAVRDCLKAAGMPVLANLGEIAKEAEKWLVEWRLVEGSPPHADIPYRDMYGNVINNFFLPGRLAMKLQRTSPYSASAGLVVRVMQENASRHPRRFVTAHVTAQAAVDAAQPPSIANLVKGIKGANSLREAILGGRSTTSARMAFYDTLVDLLVGWFEAMVMPKAYGSLEVTYCCNRPFASVPTTGQPVADGGGDGEDECLVDQASYARLTSGGR